MASSVTDARTVLLVEQLLQDGAVIESALGGNNRYQIHIDMPDGRSGTGYGESFPAAFKQALYQLPEAA